MTLVEAREHEQAARRLAIDAIRVWLRWDKELSRLEVLADPQLAFELQRELAPKGLAEYDSSKIKDPGSSGPLRRM
jgi:hypothetical protein